MAQITRRSPIMRVAASGAIALGLIGGGYGIASAANGGGQSSTTTAPAQQQPPAGARHGNETALTGTTATRVRDAVLAKFPGATIDRLETDADGNSAYEAHVTKADGTHLAVYVNAQFQVAGQEAGGPGGRGARGGRHGGPRGDETTLTGTTATKVRAAALAKVPGATVDRLETDGGAGAAYEAHLTKADGSRVTVHVDKDFRVVSLAGR